MINSNLQVVKQ